MSITGNDKPGKIEHMLADSDLPFAHRKMMLKQLIKHSSEETDSILESILNGGENNKLDKTLARKVKSYNEKLKALEEGPVRPGTFLGSRPHSSGAVTRVQVRLEDGTTVFPLLPRPRLLRELRRGDSVVLDGQAQAVISREPAAEWSGEVATYERRIGPEHVEISVRGDERHVFDASHGVIDLLNRESVEPGRRLLICQRRKFVMGVVPEEEGRVHYRYLDRMAVPDVVAERDLGDPPAYLDELMSHLRMEMTRPDLRRRYGLRRCAMKLLAGISGSGKSYSLLALWNAMYQLMAEVTGVQVEDLPSRVMRFRPAQLLSHWFGDSDRNIDRFFGEVHRLADEKFAGPGGKVYELPVLVILEEVDGMSRARGGDDIYDRIMSTLLELLDPTRQALSDRMIILVGTTNVPEQIDPAFLRRIGGTIETFGHLNRRNFREVLRKRLQRIPLAARDGMGDDDLLQGMVNELTSWLFSSNGEDHGQVEISLVGSAEPLVHRRRDFLTAGMVDRAVQQVADLACTEEDAGSANPGLTPAMLKKALDRQVRAIVDLLSPGNVGNYLQLPDGVRVQGIRVIERPVIHSFELVRAS